MEPGENGPDNDDVTGSSISGARGAWLAFAGALSALTALFVQHSDSATWEQPQLLFGVVSTAAGVCILGATVVMIVADRRELAELGLLGAALVSASVMPLVHGLVTPGVLYEDSAAFQTSAFLAVPIAVAVASPLLVPGSAFGRWAAARWRDWTVLALLGVFVLAGVVVFVPDVVVVPAPTDPLTIAVSALMVLALVRLSRRQLYYFELGRQPANMIAAMALLLLAVSATLPVVGGATYTPVVWWLHAAGALGVLAVSVALVLTRHLSRSAQDILAPILVRDPLAAFELGLSPVVHRFVADLQLKDELTRDHVIRTGEMAIRVGERMRIPAHRLRELGLAAMLHDVGKLDVPDEILAKPDRLTATEYEVIKRHAADGEAMLRAEPTLVAAAPIVRSHHERVDGTGYPDGLRGDEIPLGSRIIAACDAFDAMTHDKQYRPAMPVGLAIAVLHEHAGTQWDADVVRQVIAVLPTLPAISSLDAVGRSTALEAEAVELPSDVAALLTAVDAEI